MTSGLRILILFCFVTEIYAFEVVEVYVVDVRVYLCLLLLLLRLVLLPFFSLAFQLTPVVGLVFH